MSIRGKILLHGQTDIGSVRDHNEDAIAIDSDIALAVLADGMGGHQGGEMASAITVSTIKDIVVEKVKLLATEKVSSSTIYSAESLLIQDAIMQANTRVHESAEANPQYHGMGTTVVVTLFYNNRFTVAHVGDSRLYRFRDGDLKQITRDHSLMQELIERGFYTPKQAQDSLNKNLVTRAIGIDSTINIDMQEDIAKVNDIYLLCSDGVNDMLKDDEIKSILADNNDDLENAASEIIQQANAHGGKDNISAILVKPIKPFPTRNNVLTRSFNAFSNQLKNKFSQ